MADGARFETLAGNGSWQALWNGGHGVDKWGITDYEGFGLEAFGDGLGKCIDGRQCLKIYSPCSDPAASMAPERVILSISGPFGDDVNAWRQWIENSITNIINKVGVWDPKTRRVPVPTVRTIILQPVVGGPAEQRCPAVRDRGVCAGAVRASCQHPYIDQAIARVVSGWSRTDVKVMAGCSPEVRSCEDYGDSLGHLRMGP
jgi:hypothetical protein